MSELITSSRMTAARTCLRLHRLRYVEGLQPLAVSDKLEFGTLMHAGLEAWWLAWLHGRELLALDEAQKAITAKAKDSTTVDDVALAKACVLMAGYHLRWSPSMAEWDVLAAEQEFRAPLLGPHGKRVRGLRIAGKLDVLVRKRSDGSIWIVEHKTSAADLSPGSLYWQRLRMDSQVSMYFDGARSLGHEHIAGCIYDVIAKIDQRPYKATAPEARKYTKDGRLYANQREADETLAEFTARITEAVSTDPFAYFQRAEVARLPAEIEEARRDTYETALLIRDSRRTGMAPRNPGACHFIYGSTCPFWDACSGVASVDDPTRFRRAEKIHPELSNDQ